MIGTNMVDHDVWHVAVTRDGAWKVLREGDATATSRHETQDQALEAAKALAEEQLPSVVRVHDDQNRVIREVAFGDGPLELIQ